MKRMLLLNNCPLKIYGFIEYDETDQYRIELIQKYMSIKYKSLSELWLKAYSNENNLDTINQLISRFIGIESFMNHLEASNVEYRYYPFDEVYFVQK